MTFKSCLEGEKFKHHRYARDEVEPIPVNFFVNLLNRSTFELSPQTNYTEMDMQKRR